jgi:putative transposase
MTFSGDKISDLMIKTLILKVAGEYTFYGYRKLNHHLRKKFGIEINPKKTYRLCREMEILLPAGKRKKDTGSPIVFAKVPVSAPDEHWQMDITYITCFTRIMFVLDIIDSYSLDIVNYHLGFSITSKEVIRVVKESLRTRGIEGTVTIRTDNGPQFTSKAMRSFCKSTGIRHERIPVCSPERNPNIERFHGTLKSEFVNCNEFEGYQDFSIKLYDYIQFYGNERYHQSLRYMSPREFREAFLSNTATRGVLTV